MKKAGKQNSRQAVGLTLGVTFIEHILDVMIQNQSFMTVLVLHQIGSNHEGNIPLGKNSKLTP